MESAPTPTSASTRRPPCPRTRWKPLNRELNKILAPPAIQAPFAELGAEVLPLKPAEYRAQAEGETRLFTEIVKSRCITGE